MKILLILLLIVGSVFAVTGREIAEKSNEIQRGFVDESVETTMYLINAAGDTVERHLKSITLERPNSEDYSIIQFLNPPDVRGFARRACSSECMRVATYCAHAADQVRSLS